MADLGHELTDKELKKLEKRMRDEYYIAQRDTRKKLQDYLEQMEEGRKKQKALLDAGKITKQEYKDWCYRHAMVGQRWKDMLTTLAEDYHHTNEIALAIARQGMPDIYALNMNYATWDLEHKGRIDTGFTLYNHDTAAYLLKDQRQLMPGPSTKKQREIAANKDMQWNMQKIQSAVLQGVLQGESPYDVAKRLQQVADMDYRAAVRYARTMTTSAQNAGRYEAFRRAKRLGVDLTIEWQATLDGRTRHEHRMMHGQRTDVDKPFHTPDGYTIYYPADCTGTSTAPQSEIWNCFVGETKVASDSEIVRSYKHEYQGNLIRVRSAAGVDFTCTPNHPILTPLGWVPAASLNKGDNILVTCVGDDGALAGNGNVYHIHSSMKTLHDSLHKLGVTDNISMADFNFHGDVPTSDVEVVSKKRLLRNDRYFRFFEGGNKTVFKKTDALVLGLSHLVTGFRRINIAALRFVSRCCKSLTFFGRGLRHTDVHGFRTVSGSNSSIPEYSIDHLPATTVIRSELLNGLTSNVFLDNIIAIDYCARSSSFPRSNFTHVYNLQTENGYYFVGKSITQNRGKYNGNYYAIAKNCRCTLLSWVKGFEGDTVKSSPKMEGKSFEEWQKERPVYDKTKNASGSRQRREKRERLAEAQNVDRKPIENPQVVSWVKPIVGNHTRQQDIMATNPNYLTGGTEYHINCQRCVTTYEARRRGYDVTALPCYDADDKYGRGKGFTLPYDKGDRKADPLWYSAGLQFSQAKSFTKEQSLVTINTLMEGYGNGSRAIVDGFWSNSGTGHVFVAEYVGGKVQFFDPQNGDMDCSHYFDLMSPATISLFRVDDLPFTAAIKDVFKNDII